MNFHELVRDALEPFRETHADHTIELEHRGEGEGHWDEDALRRELADVFTRAFELAGRHPCRLWFRTDCRADDEVLLKMEISGAPAPAGEPGPKVVLRRPRQERRVDQ